MPIHRVTSARHDDELKRIVRSGETIVSDTYDERLGQYVIVTEIREETR